MSSIESGKGRIKALLSLAFLAAVVFSAVKIVPVYVSNYELQDFINNVAVQVTVQSPPPSPEAVQKEIMVEAQGLKLPIGHDNIRVSINRTVAIHLDYVVDVDLGFYTLTLHFTPSAENSNIT